MESNKKKVNMVDLTTVVVVGGILVLISYALVPTMYQDTNFWGGIEWPYRWIWILNGLISAYAFLHVSYLLRDIQDSSIQTIYWCMLLPSAAWSTCAHLGSKPLLFITLGAVGVASCFLWSKVHEHLDVTSTVLISFLLVQHVLLDAVVWLYYFP